MTIGQVCVVVVGFLLVAAVIVKQWERREKRIAREVLPAYEADDGDFTASDIDRIRKAAEPMLQKMRESETRNYRSLF